MSPLQSVLTSILGHGLWGQAKFQGSDSAPFAALVLPCIKDVLDLNLSF